MRNLIVKLNFTMEGPKDKRVKLESRKRSAFTLDLQEMNLATDHGLQ